MFPALALGLSLLAAPPSPRSAYQRVQIAGMATLTSYATTNIGVGLWGAFATQGVDRHVHEMNALWNTVNLALGIAGLVTHARRREDTKLDPRRRAIRTYAINHALDVLYIATGAVLLGIGHAHRSERGWARATGYGASIMAQGGVLFAFDAAMIVAIQRVARR